MKQQQPLYDFRMARGGTIFEERRAEAAAKAAAYAASPEAKTERLRLTAQRHMAIQRVQQSCTPEKWEDILALIADEAFLGRIGVTQADVQSGRAYEILLRYVSAKVDE
jgi:hypothetical protein